MPDPAILAILMLMVAAVCYFDFRWLLIPNWLNLAVFGTGIIVQGMSGWWNVAVSLAVAACVSFLLWSIRDIHRRVTGRIGLGLGDVKLAGASAVWFSPWNFPVYLFFASLSALTYYVLQHGFGRRDFQTVRVPFGPFLGVALVATWGIEHFQ